MSWDKEYAAGNRLWGEGPSELGIAAIAYLQKHAAACQPLKIIDIGCGYGRDAIYLVTRLNADILGIDISEKAIEIATRSVMEQNLSNAKFECRDFKSLGVGGYDVVFVSNFYQLLRPAERRSLRETISRILRPSGLLFLSTLSVSDPEHLGKGIPIAGEPNSIDIGKYLHLCTKEELAEDFSFLEIEKLYEHNYLEPRSNGEVHNHISWILVAKGRQAAKEPA